MTQTSERGRDDLRGVTPPRTPTATASHRSGRSLALVGSGRPDITDPAADAVAGAVRAVGVVADRHRTTAGLTAERRHDTTTEEAR